MLTQRVSEVVEQLADLLRAHPGTLVLTGAGMSTEAPSSIPDYARWPPPGVTPEEARGMSWDEAQALSGDRQKYVPKHTHSTESGIPDYRGADGKRRVRPMEHGEFVATSAARQRYWARSYIGWGRFTSAEPNVGHQAVARLQRAGHVGAIITQNVDGLHQRSGARDVIELHGTLADVICLDCEARIDREFLQAVMTDANPGFAELASGTAPDGSRVSSQIRPDGDIVLADDLVADFVQPRCHHCQSDKVKPDVVFFGGSVPKDRVETCYALTDAAPALLVLGSSLQVMSGFRFVRRAASHGIPIGVITRGPTRADDLVTHHVDAPLGATLTDLAARLGADGG